MLRGFRIGKKTDITTIVHAERRVLAGTDLRQSALFTQQFLVLKVTHRTPSSEVSKILLDYCHRVRTTNLKAHPHKQMVLSIARRRRSVWTLQKHRN